MDPDPPPQIDPDFKEACFADWYHMLQAGCVGEGPDVPGHLSLVRSPVLRARGAPPSLHEDQV